MRFKLVIALLIVVSGLTAAPQALDKFNELRSAAENWTRCSLLNGVLAVSAKAQEPAEQQQQRALFMPRTSGLRASEEEQFRWRGRIASGRTVEIKGVNGSVRAEPSTGSEVEVVADKSAKRSNPADVQIKVLEHAGGVTICAVYPSSEAGRTNDCTVGQNWSVQTRDNDVEVNFAVRVPSGLRFAGRTVNGSVETGALVGDVEAHTVNGEIRVSATGYAEARTVNGSIIASLGSADWPRPLAFHTVNGSITLNLPPEIGAMVNAETLNGSINTNFEVTVEGRFSRRRMNGTIGDGRHQLSLKTVNGSINIRRAR
jgi:hypothetical protein